MATAALGVLLVENAAQAAPALVLRELGKMTLVSGAAHTAAAAGAGIGGAGAAAAIGIKAKILIGTVIAALGIGGGVVTYKVIYSNGGLSNPTAVSEAENTRQPTVAVSRVPAGGAVYGNFRDDTADRGSAGASGGYGVTTDNSGAMGYGGGYGGGNVPVFGGMAVRTRETIDENQPTVGMAVPSARGTATVATGFGGIYYPPGTNPPAIDLTGPDKTIESFSKLLARGDVGRLSECFVPGAQDYLDLMSTVLGNNTEGEQARLLYSSIGEPVEITDVTSD
jgi:hypothetical protein